MLFSKFLPVEYSWDSEKERLTGTFWIWNTQLKTMELPEIQTEQTSTYWSEEETYRRRDFPYQDCFKKKDFNGREFFQNRLSFIYLR